MLIVLLPKLAGPNTKKYGTGLNSKITYRANIQMTVFI